MALAEVYEVATFYAHFDVVKEGETPPPAVTVRVCDSLSCAMAGADKLLADLQAKYGKDVRVIRAPCMGACDVAPVVAVGHVQTFHADAAKGRAGGEGARARACRDARQVVRHLSVGRRLRAAEVLSRRRAHARGHDQGGGRFRPARPWRRRLPDRTQMDLRARGKRPAPDGRQRRRGRARHVQGSLLSRPRSAPLHRGHADRRLGGRGRAMSISICATNIPNCG